MMNMLLLKFGKIEAGNLKDYPAFLSDRFPYNSFKILKL